MKKHFLFIAALVLITASCNLFDQLDELTQFDLPYDTSISIDASIDIPIPAGQELKISTPPVKTNSEEQFTINKTAKNLLEEVKLKEITLEVTSPKSGDFDFLTSLTIYITAEGLEETKVASITEIPKGTNKITLNVEDVDLMPYITGDEISFKTETVTGEAIFQSIDINLHSVFHIDAKILGI